MGALRPNLRVVSQMVSSPRFSQTSVRGRSTTHPIRLRGQKAAEGILAVRRGGLREQSLMGWVVERPRTEVYEKCGLG